MTHIILATILAANAISTASPTPMVNDNVPQAPGEWTKCIMYLTDGVQVNVVKGQSSQKRCFDQGKKCASNMGWSYNTIKYFSNPIIIQAPYKRCS